MASLLIVAMLVGLDLDCGDFDEWVGPPPQCTCIDLINTPADDEGA